MTSSETASPLRFRGDPLFALMVSSGPFSSRGAGAVGEVRRWEAARPPVRPTPRGFPMLLRQPPAEARPPPPRASPAPLTWALGSRAVPCPRRPESSRGAPEQPAFPASLRRGLPCGWRGSERSPPGRGWAAVALPPAAQCLCGDSQHLTHPHPCARPQALPPPWNPFPYDFRRRVHLSRLCHQRQGPGPLLRI